MVNLLLLGMTTLLVAPLCGVGPSPMIDGQYVGPSAPVKRRISWFHLDGIRGIRHEFLNSFSPRSSGVHRLLGATRRFTRRDITGISGVSNVVSHVTSLSFSSRPQRQIPSQPSPAPPPF